MNSRAVSRRRYMGLFAAGLFCVSGSLFAEPQPKSDVGREPTVNHVWGDPEEHKEADPGWTWFGMGYESRRRARHQLDFGGAPDSSGVPKGTNEREK